MWASIADVVQEMRRHLGHVQGESDVRAAGAALAIHARGRLVEELPELVNFGALTYLAQPFRVHELRGNVTELVAATDLHSLPDEPPRLLTNPWIVQCQEPERNRLFGDTASLAGYELNGTRYLIGLDYPDGCLVARWRPQWRGGDLAAGVVREDSGGLVEDVMGHEEWARQAARFAVVLGLLLDAEGAPLSTEDEGPALAGTRHGKPRPARPWAVRRVRLDGIAASASHEHGTAGAGSVEGLTAASVAVRGHLKRQPCGENRQLRKWVYVARYEARRWFTSCPTKVVVS